MIKLVNTVVGVGAWNLSVSEAQKSYVSSRDVILGKAWLNRKYRPRVYWIYNDDYAVGMVYWHDNPEDNCYILSQLFIDERYQGQGFGTQTVKIALERMRKQGRYPKVMLCYVEGNEQSRKLFSKFGFVQTDKDYDEIIMELTL